MNDPPADRHPSERRGTKQPSKRRGKQKRSYSADARLAMLYKTTPEAMQWKAKKAAEAIDATDSAVRKTETWKCKQAMQREERERWNRKT